MSDEFIKQRFHFDAGNVRMVSSMRAILATAALVTTYIDPSEPRRLAAATYTALILYGIYSLILYILSRRKINRIPVEISHWIDVGFYLILIALSAGTSSVFFFLFFFAILTASFRFGFAEGMKVTLFSAIMFGIIGNLTAPSGEEFELNRTLLRPVYLCVLGYMTAYWGGEELKFKKRLAILRDINKLCNPRFGIDQTINVLMQKILVSFNADACLLITANTDMSGYTLRQSYRENPEQALNGEQIDGDNPLIKFSCDTALIYSNIKRWWSGNTGKYQVFDLQDIKRIGEPLRNGEALSDFLETNSFISIPLCQREDIVWRVYVTSQTKVFDFSDIEFLRQLLERALPVTENVNLLDRLASEATEQQRNKISRDIHDSTIQPYIGIKLALEALQIKHGSKNGIGKDLKQIIDLAETNIRDIRSYLNRLRGDKSDVKVGNVLVLAVKQQAKKIGEFYGIHIEVFAEDNFINISDRLSAEVFQVVTESLSNIKRHTKADYARINIVSDDRTLKLKIENNNPTRDKIIDFVPKSITGRVRALGGNAFVKNNSDNTIVTIEIPL